MTVRLFESTDAGAPQLSGAAAGQVLAILDACLVDGYGTKVSAGWTKAFTGTDIRVYRPALGTRFYYRIDDTSVVTSNRSARLVGYRSMTDLNTGTGAFPTNAQVSGGLHIPAAAVATAGNRPWVVIADEYSAYIYLDFSTSTASLNGQLVFIGDFLSRVPSDAQNAAIIASTSPNGSSPNFGGQQTISATGTGQYLAGNYAQSGVSTGFGKSGDYALSPASNLGGAGAPYPNPASGEVLVSRIKIAETDPQQALRGALPGIIVPGHAYPWTTGQTFDGQGDLVGKTFYAFRGGAYCVAVEISNTWR